MCLFSAFDPLICLFLQKELSGAFLIFFVPFAPGYIAVRKIEASLFAVFKKTQKKKTCMFPNPFLLK